MEHNAKGAFNKTKLNLSLYMSIHDYIELVMYIPYYLTWLSFCPFR